MKKIFFVFSMVIFFCFVSIAEVQAILSDSLTGQIENNLFIIKELNLKLVKCPAGSFMMGGSPIEVSFQIEKNQILINKGLQKYSHKDVYGFEYNENLHRVTISKPFFIGKYEVTQKEYETLMGYNPLATLKLLYENNIGDNNPVCFVSWYDAKKFCNKLNKSVTNIPKGYRFDLPTEAQWEYACRAGTTTMLNSGKNIIFPFGVCKNLNEVGWYGLNSGNKLHSVGQKKPNAWGIYDMHGNVAEWCRDHYGEYTNGNDPIVTDTGLGSVCRGGDFTAINGLANDCRSSTRSTYPTDFKNFTGFRIALVPEESHDSTNSTILKQIQETTKETETVLMKLEEQTENNSSFEIKDIKLEMIKCPSGSFMMGKEKSYSQDEYQHKVTISKPFYIGKYEVTQYQYETIIGKILLTQKVLINL